MALTSFLTSKIDKFAESASKGITSFLGETASSVKKGLAQSELGKAYTGAKTQIKDATDYFTNPPIVVTPLNTGKVKEAPLTIDNTSVTNPIIDMSSAPTNRTDTSNIGTNFASISSGLENVKSQLLALQGEQAKTKETPTTGGEATNTTGTPDWVNKLTSLFTQGQEKMGEAPVTPTLDEVTNSILAKFGYTPESFKQVSSLTNELGTLNQQIAALDTQESLELARVEGLGGQTADFGNAEANRISREYAIRKAGVSAKASAITAQVSALTGAYDKAESAAKDYVNYATAERKQFIDDIKYSIDFYKDVYEKMDESDRQRVNDLLDYQVALYKQEQEDYWKEMNYNLDVWKAQNPASGGSSGNIDTWANGLMTGQFNLSNVPMGLRDAALSRVAELGGSVVSTAFAGKAKEAISAFNTAEQMLSSIESLSVPINTGGNFVTANIGGLMKWIGGTTGASKNAKLFMDEKKAFLPMLTKAAGEKGVLTSQDVQRIENALPTINDRKDVAEAKLANLRKMFSDIKYGTVSAYTNPLPSGGTNTSDPLGIR